VNVEPAPQPKTLPTKRIVAGVVALAVGAALVVAVVVVAPADTLTSAREQRAVCLVQRDNAADAEQRARAEVCIADMDRVIAVLEQPAPAPTTAPPSPGPLRFPTPATAGLPANWAPKTTRVGDLRITTAGTVVEDLRITGSIFIETPQAVVRRVEVLGGNIKIALTACRGHKPAVGATVYPLIEDSTFRKRAVTQASDVPAIEPGGYVARRVSVLDRPEGLRVGGRSNGCGPVTIDQSYLRIVSPDVCEGWHGDGIQGYDGNTVALTNSTVDFQATDACGGTAPYFVPGNQGNLNVTIDRLLVKGGGFAFRLGVPGTVRGLRIVDGSWGYGPIDVKCSVVTAWEASIVHIDPAGQVVTTVRSQPCSTEGGR
jgi:hypothetical protein